jgi:hypothetical protein
MVKGVGVQMLTLYGVARREVKSAGAYYVVFKARAADAYMGEGFGLPLLESFPTSAFWAWKNVSLQARVAVIARQRIKPPAFGPGNPIKSNPASLAERLMRIRLGTRGKIPLT